MAKCKCLVELKSDTGKVFEVNKYYGYDFISSIGDRPSFFRVYFDDDTYEKVEVKVFKNHFKKY